MTDRELFLLGVGVHWAEGSKSKARRIRESVTFVNSDPDMISVYLARPELLGVEPDRLRYRVLIHGSADMPAAEQFRADLTKTDVRTLGKTTLEKHSPKTVRKNAGSGCHGCLVVRVRGSADLYRRIEGWWCGIVVSAKSAPGQASGLA
ncbi:hypothetical protein [Streptomyces sp. NPDC048845]|uniref:hypothetical protein n=1 Tax=Streptomyces sp. NPDC048845 TaxID=3155390 RepID=UPI003441505F